MMNRIITLVDMDCFFCQVEARLNPSLKGKPLAVVQYNRWKGGMIIAVNYEARNFGVTRSMRGDEARRKCPNIVLLHVPEVRGKADLSKYCDAGREVADVFCQFSHCVQRASVDEAYIDLTEGVEQRITGLHRVQSSQLATTFVVGFTDVDSNDEEKRQQGLTSWLESASELQDPVQLRLAVAGVIVEEMRAAVFQQTGFHCSAGISHNKILGKLACGLHKPNRQTILPQTGVLELFETLPIRKVRSLGGKFGCVVMEQLGCRVMADLLQFTESQLQQQFDEKTGTWLYNIARGIDHDPVTRRLVSESIGCCKKFPGKQALGTKTDVQFWLSQLSAEVAERLTKDLKENKRRGKLLTASYHQDINSCSTSSSRSGPLTSYDPQRIMADAFELIKKSNTSSAGGSDSWYPPLKYLGLSVGKFVCESAAQNSTINDFFGVAQKESNKVVHENISGTNSQKHRKIMLPDSSKVSSRGNSFFMKYLKQHSVTKSAETSTGMVSVSTHECRPLDNIDLPISNVLDTNSDDDMFESPVTDMEKQKKEKSNLPVRTMTTEFNSEVSTSMIENHTDDDSSKMWVSLGELFPDISSIDDDVVALLPVPLQERLQARIEKVKHSSRISKKCNLTNITSNDKVIDPTDSQFVGGHSQDETEQGAKDINAFIHAAECVTQSEMEKQPCNRNLSPKAINLLYHSDDQKDDLPSKSHCVLQHTRGENLDHIQVCGDIFPPDAKQQYLSASHVLLSHRDEASRASTDCMNHCKLDVSCAKNILASVPEEHDTENSESIVAENCPHCGKDVPLSEYAEHLDFHTAEKLHKELNGLAVHVKSTANASAQHRNPPIELQTKRKRGSLCKKPSVIDHNKKMRSITAFFTPK